VASLPRCTRSALSPPALPSRWWPDLQHPGALAAAILLWAVAALAGWILLHDQVQQTLTLLLFPAWIFSELAYYSEGHIGEDIYLGRFLFVWAILYLTVFLHSRRKACRGYSLLPAPSPRWPASRCNLRAGGPGRRASPLCRCIFVSGMGCLCALPLLFSVFACARASFP